MNYALPPKYTECRINLAWNCNDECRLASLDTTGAATDLVLTSPINLSILNLMEEEDSFDLFGNLTLRSLDQSTLLLEIELNADAYLKALFIRFHAVPGDQLLKTWKISDQIRSLESFEIPHPIGLFGLELTGLFGHADSACKQLYCGVADFLRASKYINWWRLDDFHCRPYPSKEECIA